MYAQGALRATLQPLGELCALKRGVLVRNYPLEGGNILLHMSYEQHATELRFVKAKCIFKCTVCDKFHVRSFKYLKYYIEQQF